MRISDEAIAAEQQRLPGLGAMQAYRIIQARRWLLTTNRATARRITPTTE